MKRVLLVEADAEVVHALCHALGGHFDVDVAGNASIAEALLRQHAYDAVLTELELPGGNGNWVLERCRDLRPRARRVLTSARDASGFACVRVMHRFVPKPASAGTLLCALGQRGEARSTISGCCGSSFRPSSSVLRAGSWTSTTSMSRTCTSRWAQGRATSSTDAGFPSRRPRSTSSISIPTASRGLRAASADTARSRTAATCWSRSVSRSPASAPSPPQIFSTVFPAPCSRRRACCGTSEPFLREGGTFFGVTVLGEGVEGTGALYRWTNRLYNRQSIFCNLHDNAADLERILAANFASTRSRWWGASPSFAEWLEADDWLRCLPARWRLVPSCLDKIWSRLEPSS